MKYRTLRRMWSWGREVRPTLALAVPIVSGMLGQMLMGLADTVMIGRVGVIPLAASSFVNMLFHLPLVFGFGLLSAVSVLSAQAYGAGQRRETGEVLRHGLAMSAVAGILLGIVLIASRLFHGALDQPPAVVAESRDYLILVSASLVTVLIGHAAKQFSEALNRPWIPTLLLLGSVALNVLLNWVLIYGHWGAEAMGLAGAGWATLIARVALMIVTLMFVVGSPSLRSYHPSNWFAPLSWSRMRRLLSIGLPVGLQHLLEVSAFSFAVLMMGWIGAEAIAAHQIAITCAATTFMMPLGIGMAVSIRVGQVWGSGLLSRVRRIGVVGLVMAVVLMSCAAVAFITAGEPISQWFISAPEVVKLATAMLAVAAVFQVFDGLQVVSISALRGMSDVRLPTLIAVLAYWVIAVPVGYVLAFHSQIGAVGIWIGLAIGLGSAAVGLLWRFFSKTRPKHL